VFKIDIETCSKCGDTVKAITCIEDPVIIEKMLAHLNEKTPPVQAPPLPKSRAPPQAVWLDWPEVTRIFLSLLLPTGTRQGIGWSHGWK
jgi:hypothetical protein